MSIYAEACTVKEEFSAWWIDNGATRHVTNSLHYYTDFQKFEEPYSIKAAGTETLTAFGKGTIRFSSIGKQEITLNNVWYAPKVSRNLFSVLVAQDLNPNKFTSSVTKCSLEVNGKQLLYGTRKQCGTLYKAVIKPILP